MHPCRRPLLPLALMLLPAALPAAAETQPFRVLNRTGQEARELNAVRSPRGAASDWGRNLLPRPLAADSVFALRPAESAGCRFDIRLVLADGREARVQDQDICANPVVALAPESVAAATTAAPRPAALPRPGAAEGPPQARANPGARVASGTGFVVAPDRVLTNQQDRKSVV